MAGLSGLALHVPRPRVGLDRWCEWTGASFDKVRAVVGDAFRVAARHDDVYGLSANAVLRLIERYDVDPARVGYLVLATESSLDNAVGGPTVKGLVDLGLTKRGLPPLSRELETFEMKQACLSGVNGLLGALRFVTTEPDRVAIVVAGDIAEYARGSSGEQTQGAGAVAMLVESDARLLQLDPRLVGRSAADRVCDFRKPMRGESRGPIGRFAEARPPDYPAFAGHYSTHCYLDAVDHAFSDLLAKTDRSASNLLEASAMVLQHRPYEKMPQTSLARMCLRAHLERDADRARLEGLAAELGVSLSLAVEQLHARPDLARLAREQGVEVDPAPELGRLVRAFTKTESFRDFLERKTGFGRSVVRQLGNLYAASLPAWIGAAFEDARDRGAPLDGREVLLVGYGSGDASITLIGRVAAGWTEAAGRAGFAEALEGAIDLSRDAYERNHDREAPVEVETRGEVGLTRVGAGDRGFDDRGVPYYAFAD